MLFHKQVLFKKKIIHTNIFSLSNQETDHSLGIGGLYLFIITEKFIKIFPICKIQNQFRLFKELRRPVSVKQLWFCILQ